MREYRDYYAAKDAYPYTDGWTPAVLAIVCANVVVYIAMHVAVKAGVTTAPELYSLFAFVPDRALVHGHRFWQLVTYAFLHDLGNPFHLLLNMYMLWIAGRELEFLYGKLRFVRFYVAAAIVGALVYALSTVPFAEDVDVPMLGASGAVMAVLVVYALYHPNDRFLLFFLLDVPVWAGVALLVAMDVSMAFKLAPAHGVAAACHLGGAAFGLAYWRFGDRTEALVEARRVPHERSSRADPEPGSKLEDDLDQVLRKLHASGMQSLTPEERAILERASKHYRERR
jgi:membrane associated rhomboid family serine protease